MASGQKATLAKKTSKQANGGLEHEKPAVQRSWRSPLSEEMLARFDSRAATYDRENRFFDQDFEDLRATKYLVLPLPSEFGGPGLSLAEVCSEQRRLAYYAPATALAVNMHLYWIGVAADLWRRGDTSLEWMLRDAAAGEIFAAGHAESGNDIPVLLSCSKAERVEGGYRFTGRKQFGSLTPVWTRFGLHGMDARDPKLQNTSPETTDKSYRRLIVQV
jgi:alkylation response protein AidB-like acyl-CoA dehydrogenase